MHKTLALGILLLPLLAIYFLANQFYLQGLRTLEKDIAVERQKAARVEALLAREQYYSEKIGKARKRINQQRIFLNSTQSSGASSEIQNSIKRLISKYSRAKILTIKPYPAVSHDGYNEVSVEIRMKDISHEELQKMLHAMETHAPVIVIKELEINQTRLNYKSLVGKLGSSSDLNSTLVASAFFKGETK